MSQEEIEALMNADENERKQTTPKEDYFSQEEIETLLDLPEDNESKKTEPTPPKYSGKIQIVDKRATTNPLVMLDENYCLSLSDDVVDYPLNENDEHIIEAIKSQSPEILENSQDISIAGYALNDFIQKIDETKEYKRVCSLAGITPTNSDIDTFKNCSIGEKSAFVPGCYKFDETDFAKIFYDRFEKFLVEKGYGVNGIFKITDDPNISSDDHAWYEIKFRITKNYKDKDSHCDIAVPKELKDITIFDIHSLLNEIKEVIVSIGNLDGELSFYLNVKVIDSYSVNRFGEFKVLALSSEDSEYSTICMKLGGMFSDGDFFYEPPSFVQEMTQGIEKKLNKVLFKDDVLDSPDIKVAIEYEDAKAYNNYMYYQDLIFNVVVEVYQDDLPLFDMVIEFESNQSEDKIFFDLENQDKMIEDVLDILKDRFEWVYFNGTNKSKLELKVNHIFNDEKTYKQYLPFNDNETIEAVTIKADYANFAYSKFYIFYPIDKLDLIDTSGNGGYLPQMAIDAMMDNAYGEDSDDEDISDDSYLDELLKAFDNKESNIETTTDSESDNQSYEDIDNLYCLQDDLEVDIEIKSEVLDLIKDKISSSVYGITGKNIVS